jgi:cell division topological specificity factor
LLASSEADGRLGGQATTAGQGATVDMDKGGRMGFLDQLLGRQETRSSVVAKERLQLVLVHDRIKISSASLEQMKDELITVISRYVEIDPDGVQVTFTQSKRASRLTADIPVIGPKRPGSRQASAG